MLAYIQINIVYEHTCGVITCTHTHTDTLFVLENAQHVCMLRYATVSFGNITNPLLLELMCFFLEYVLITLSILKPTINVQS